MERLNLIWFVQGYMLINQENIPRNQSFDEACNDMHAECRGKNREQLMEFYNLTSEEIDETIQLGRY